MQIISKNFHVQNIYKNLSCLDLSLFRGMHKDTNFSEFQERKKSAISRIPFLRTWQWPQASLVHTIPFVSSLTRFCPLFHPSPLLSLVLEAWSLINLAPSPRNREFSHLRDRIVPWKKINCCASVSFNRLLLSSWSVACVENRDFFFDEFL